MLINAFNNYSIQGNRNYAIEAAIRMIQNKIIVLDYYDDDTNQFQLFFESKYGTGTLQLRKKDCV